jgi:hypothetical protein
MFQHTKHGTTRKMFEHIAPHVASGSCDLTCAASTCSCGGKLDASMSPNAPEPIHQPKEKDKNARKTKSKGNRASKPYCACSPRLTIDMIS